jgi:hypothetical protein
MSPRIRYFKLSEALDLDGEFSGMSEPLRDEKLRLLMDTISEHRPCGIASVVNKKAFDEHLRIMIRPYFLSFFSITGSVLQQMKREGYPDRVNFIFDEQDMDKDQVLSSWFAFKHAAADPEILRVIGSTPYFAKDTSEEMGPALQAADLQAGWVRRMADAESSGGTHPVMPWGDRGNGLARLTRVWKRSDIIAFRKKFNWMLSDPRYFRP